MEKESEVLRTKISSCERAKKGADASISNLKEELERERKSVLELQKENGQLEGKQIEIKVEVYLVLLDYANLLAKPFCHKY